VRACVRRVPEGAVQRGRARLAVGGQQAFPQGSAVLEQGGLEGRAAGLWERVVPGRPAGVGLPRRPLPPPGQAHVFDVVQLSVRHNMG
jgi:hypothetical protein